MHEYYHVQPSIRRVSDGPIYKGCYEWMPESTPAIPANVECPLAFVMFVLISFYGKGFYDKILSPESLTHVKLYIENYKELV